MGPKRHVYNLPGRDKFVEQTLLLLINYRYDGYQLK